MGKEEVDHVDRPVEKKTLLEKYDIPVEHLSYEYITQCENVKELERIVRILRSGEEGCYPDLTKHAEERLAIVAPGSSVLKIAEPVIKRNMLAPEKRMQLENDINEWMSEMKLREKDLEEGRAMQINESIQQPAIRQITFDEPQKNRQSSQNQKKSKRIGACDYAGWDKYDADTELNRIDLQHEQKQAEAKRAQKKLRDKEEKNKKASREDIINNLTLTGTELSVMAEKEREKGNEAFKAGDYEEALQFYNSSIAIDATINAYNNRAITYVKLQRYDDAVNDCNAVISMDYTNIKALLRRGLALDHLEKRLQALADYEAVLKLEPSNKVAITALNKLRGPCDSKKIRMKIEDGSATDENALGDKSSTRKVEDSAPVESKSESKKSKITPHGNSALSSSQNCSNNLSNGKAISKRPSPLIKPDKVAPISQIRSQVCFCDNAPSSSQYSSPQPHLRDIYCPEATQSNAKFPKPQSIFTENSSGKSSGVIIEEIPNEPCDRSGEKLNSTRNKPMKRQDATLTNYGTGDNGAIAKKSGVVSEELSQDKYNHDVKNVKKNNKTCSKTPKKSTNFVNSRNTFAGTKNSYDKASGVIIEEILDEPCVKFEVRCNSEKTGNRPKTHEETKTISKNFGSGDNEAVTKKSGAVIEELSTERYDPQKEQKKDKKINNNSSKTPDKSAMPPKPFCTDISISSEKSSRFVIEDIRIEPDEKLGEVSVSDKTKDKSKTLRESCETLNFSGDKKEEVVEKSSIVEDKHSKEECSFKFELTQESKFDPIESPYEFLRLWHSMRNDDDLVLHANLLKALLPENIDTGNKLDGEMLSTILHCFERHFCAPENSKQLLRFLQYLGKVKRFSLVRMFMDGKDKKVLQNIFSFLEGQGFSVFIRDLRKIYDIPM